MSPSNVVRTTESKAGFERFGTAVLTTVECPTRGGRFYECTTVIYSLTIVTIEFSAYVRDAVSGDDDA